MVHAIAKLGNKIKCNFQIGTVNRISQNRSGTGNFFVQQKKKKKKKEKKKKKRKRKKLKKIITRIIKSRLSGDSRGSSTIISL